jgi:integrase
MARQGRALSSGRLFKEKRGDGPERWILDWRAADGLRRRQALSTDKRVAERMRADLIRKRDLEMAGLGSEEGQDKQLRELAGLYVADLRVRACPLHVSNVATRIETMLTAIGAERVRDLVPYRLMQRRAARITEGAAVRTANLEVDTLKAMLNWAVRAGLVAANPIANLQRLPEREAAKVHRRRAMTEAEIEAFLAAARADDADNARHHGRIPLAPLWRAFLEVGARYGELVRVTWSDFDTGRRTLRLRAETTKSGRERTVPLRDVLAREIESLRAANVAVIRRPLRPDDRIFLTAKGCPWPTPTTNLMRVFNRTLEAAGIDRVDGAGKKLDIHALRHTVATRFVRNGVGMAQAQKLLGHSSIELTAKVYTHLDVEDLRDAIDRLDSPALRTAHSISETA